MAEIKLSFNKQSNKYNIVSFIIVFMFFIGFSLIDGPEICVDSGSYIEMSIIREYFYPLFLLFFRSLFKEEMYLSIVVIVQGLITSYTIWNISIYLRKKFSLSDIQSYLVIVILLAPSLFCRFFAGRGSMYSNSILTESLTIPIYMLFIRYVHEYIVEKNRSSFIWSLICIFFLISMRKQMLFTILIMVGAYVFVNHEGNLLNVLKSAVKAIVIGLLIVVLMTLCDRTYNLFIHDKFVGHTSDSRFLLTMLMYSSEKEYGDNLSGDSRELFYEIYDECEEKGYLGHSAGKGWLNRTEHYGDYYDLIQETCNTNIQEYVINHFTEDITDRNVIADEVSHEITKGLLVVCAPKMITVLLDSVLTGLVTTASVRRPIFIEFALIVYLIYAILLCIIILLRKKELKDVIKWSLLVIVATLLNVGIVSAVIFCQTRYTIYNMAYIYISIILMLINLRRQHETISGSP